ncbi:hypothetical protein BCR36DRAFT_280564 [Piromyces finnis]|uniref:Uncharacterized protein n=1 Tax=Piromyces finnis TaxID=1754191 RepID=A0A1Y1VH08_9FUNG|nr:hypothetical protein BCR36DRAFT_280564 [Piromyces finnis]|eukprot:ORX56015.1 hypothetical protein BCR36DRAFT_280564 [Piromyces finnis]
MPGQFIKFNNITLTNSNTLINGKNINIDILNSKFSNIFSKKSIPIITDAKYSFINILNTTFSDLNLISELIDGESKYTLDNIKFSNITTNSKFLLHFMYNDIFINNIEVENISCIGEAGNTSFILFDSGEKNCILTIKNSIMKNNYSNGSFIRIVGDSTKLFIENTIFHEIESYGSIIENQSKLTKLSISDLKFTKNTNRNKFGCGILYLCNDVDISIISSEFNNNISKNNGGAICLYDLKKLLLNLNSNVFSDNQAMNGGALYIKDNSDFNVTNENFYFTMNNNSFNNNIAENFGGAVVTEFKNKYNNVIIKNNIFIHNKAGIMGGGLFSHNLYNKSFFINNIDINDDKNYNLIGNTGSFSNGHCELNNFRIFSNPNRYYLNIWVENNGNNNNIEIKNNEIEIEILGCDENQIKMYDKDGILYCENAICKDNCPIDISANCIPYYNERYNNIDKNICSCLPGWTGNNLQNSDNLKSILLSSQSVSICNTNYMNSNNNTKNILELESLYSDNISINKENNKNIEIMLNRNGYLDSYNNRISNLKNKKENNVNIISRIANIHSIYIKILIIYPLYVISIFFFVFYYMIYNNKNDDVTIVQNKDGYWNYKCNLEKTDFTYNIIHFIIIILLINSINKTIYYEWIFKITSYIVFSLYIAISIGPLINVINYI